jgi:crotonobetainyl-CoA:carnitine CoA-transferase CaiB-like acyl-CoA transferase
MPALDDIRVIELGSLVAAPYCGKLLGDLGADVVKVEPPQGDPARRTSVFPGVAVEPEASPLFLWNNTSKRGIRCDLAAGTRDRELLADLLAGADALIEDTPHGFLESIGLGRDELARRNPSLVVTSISPYGRTGRRAAVPGGELTVTHAGGLGSLLPSRSEDVDRAPIKLGGWQVAHTVGIVAALATLGALLGRRRDGRGRHVDVSMQEVVLALVAPLVPGPRYNGTSWSRVPDRPPAMGRLRTRDGYVILNAFDDHHFDAFREVMGRPAWCAGDEWKSMAYRSQHFMDIGERLEAWMLEQTKDDIHHRAAKKGIPIGPICSAADVMANPQFAARGFFTEVEHPVAGRTRTLGVPYQMAASPARISRPAPLLGQHDDEVRAEVGDASRVRVVQGGSGAVGAPSGGAGIAAAGGRVSGGAPPGATDRLPLRGVRIAELCWVWAGPYCGTLLASLGAEVIKVEGHRRTDMTRRNVIWPLPEPAPRMLPPNQGLAFNTVNLGKKSLAVDLSRPEGAAVARKLAALSDVVVDNMRPRALEALGLGYQDLRQVRRDIIVASSSGRGYQGPESNYLGFASVHQGIGGGAYVTGYADDHPCHSGGDVDLMNAMTLALAIVAALHHRARTGEGQFIDYSQCEGASELVGDLLLAHEMTGRVPERMGNADPASAPHGVYRAWGVDRWVAIEVHDDAAFARLAAAIEQPGLASDPRFATAPARKRNEAELDGVLSAWIRRRDRDAVVAQLEAAGVAAAPVRDGRDLYADRHLRDREAFVTVDHPELGQLELVRAPWQLDGEPAPASVAPLLGQHDDAILGELLGYGADEIAALRAADVVL